MKIIRNLFYTSFVCFSLLGCEPPQLTLKQSIEYHRLVEQLKSLDVKPSTSIHTICSVSVDGTLLTLEDDSVWSIGIMSRSKAKDWKPGDQLYISRVKGVFNNILFKNPATNQQVTGTMHTLPRYSAIIKIKELSKEENSISLSNGTTFKCQKNTHFVKEGWEVKDLIYLFQNNGHEFQIWNMSRAKIACSCVLTDQGTPDILLLEGRLNQKVIQQQEACCAVSSALLNYSAGLNVEEKPIGVFLFLGPTGVGKTELAKVLTDELFDGDRSHMIRFDMSHFSEPHAVARLIGSPPGYVNHEEGGQLTEALKQRPHSITLLDEMEKAHPTVRKFFLPVFDEGYIVDNKNHVVDCKQVIFIMTSNLCGYEIAQLCNEGYDTDDILTMLEPTLMEHLSPELYNRVEPVIFRSLTLEGMGRLVDLMLIDLAKKVYAEKKIQLHFAPSTTQFLIENGFHPLLGARPLKKLITNKVVTALAYAIVKNEVHSGDAVTLSYDCDQERITLTVESEIQIAPL